MIEKNIAYAVPFPERAALVDEIRALISVLRRHLLLILTMMPVGLFVGYAASYLIEPAYQAQAQITLDPRRTAIAQPVNAQTQRRDEPLIDSGRADTEAETIESESVIRGVVVSLELANNPEFKDDSPGLMDAIKALFSEKTPALSENQRIDNIILSVSKGLKVERIEKGYSFLISYEAHDPNLAAKVANAFADVYVEKQLEADYAVTRQAVTWLKARTDQLAEQMLNASRAASEYQTKARISRSNGKLVDEEQLENLNKQLADAASQRAQAKARFDQVMNFNSESIGELTVTDALQNTVVSKLRMQYFELTNRADSLAPRYGDNHAAVLKLRTDAKAIQDSIKRELLRYQESYKNDYDVALARETSLKASLAEQIERATATGEAQVKLNAMEAQAQSLKASYEGFMQRYNDALQRQNFPVSEARVISTATPPTFRSKPKRTLLAAGGALLGLLSSLVAASILELMHRKIRTRLEAEAAAGVECFGYIPRVRLKGQRRLEKVWQMPLDFAAQNPFAIYAETLRIAKTTIDQQNKGIECSIIGVISCLPDEGKTTISGNLAFMLSRQSRRVLLIDGDMRNPSLSAAVALVQQRKVPAEPDATEERQSVVDRSVLPFDFLPASTGRQEGATDQQNIFIGIDKSSLTTNLEVDQFRKIVEKAKAHYDYIVVDLPPIVPLSDVRAVARYFTNFVMVLSWGKSNPQIVSDAIESMPGIHDKLAGSVLNMVEMDELERYGEKVSPYYNSKYFS